MDKKNVWLWLDPSRRCNLVCTLCYTKPSHGADDLTRDTLAAVLDNVLGEPSVRLVHVTFNWRGEPLMNKQYPQLLGDLRRRGLSCPVQFHTNATLLLPRLAEAVVEQAGDVSIYLSIDGGSRASHERNRGEGTFDAAIAGGWNLLRARGRRRIPRIYLYQLGLGELVERYAPEFLDLASAVDEWFRVAPVLPDGDAATIARAPRQAGGVLPADGSLPSAAGSRPALGACFWAGNALVVAPNGDASICLLSNSPDGVLGNLCRDPVAVVLERSVRWRGRLAADGRRAVPHCAACLKCDGDGYAQDELGSAAAGPSRAAAPARPETWRQLQ